MFWMRKHLAKQYPHWYSFVFAPPHPTTSSVLDLDYSHWLKLYSLVRGIFFISYIFLVNSCLPLILSVVGPWTFFPLYQNSCFLILFVLMYLSLISSHDLVSSKNLYKKNLISLLFLFFPPQGNSLAMTISSLVSATVHWPRKVLLYPIRINNGIRCREKSYFHKF